MSAIKTHPTGTRFFDDAIVNHSCPKLDPTDDDFLLMWHNIGAAEGACFHIKELPNVEV
jgi:hypothetical protein